MTGQPHTKNINRIWNTACDDAGVVRVPLNNACRHSWGCQMLNAGIDKAVVQRLLGHSDPRMTDRYAEHSMNALKIRLDNVIKMQGRKQGNSKQAVDLENIGHESN